MNNIIKVLEIILPIFVTISLGVLAKKKNTISEEGIKGLQKLVMTFCVPCVLFNSCLTGDFGMESVGTAGGVLNTAMGLFGFILPTIVASIFGDNYKGIFTLMAVFLVIIGLIGGLVIPELGEKGKLAKKARGEL